jgi:hypothetical protein
VSPLWALHLAPIRRSAGLWLFAQVFLVPIAHEMTRGAELLEAELVVLAVLVALGSQGGLSRERMEYLRHLPLEREQAERFAHFSSQAVLLGASLFAYMGELTGAVRYGWQVLWWTLQSYPREWGPTWEPHWARAPWLNVFWLPVFAYWIVVAILRRLRTLPGTLLLERWRGGLVIAIVVALPFLGLTGLFLSSAHQPFVHDSWMRNLPGALAFVATWPLSRWVRRRSERAGIDAFPVEEAAWEF